jgi:hypothetical protein
MRGCLVGMWLMDVLINGSFSIYTSCFYVATLEVLFRTIDRAIQYYCFISYFNFGFILFNFLIHAMN